MIVNDVARDVPLNIPYAFLNVNIEGNPGNDVNKKFFKIDLESSRLSVDTNEINNIHLFYFTDNYSDSASVNVSDELIVFNLGAVKPASSKLMSLTGDIGKLDLHDFIPGMFNGSFSSGITGTILSDNTVKEVSLEFRNNVVTSDQDTVSLPELKIGLQSGSDFIKINLNTGTGNFLEAKTGKKFPPFTMPLNKWLADWPETYARASFKPDTELLRRMTGHDIRINIENLYLKKDSKKWITELSIPRISYDSTSAEGINMNISSTIDEIRGRFGIDKLKNPGIVISPVEFNISYSDSVYYLMMESMLNDRRSRSVLSLEMADFLNGYRIRLNEADSLIVNNSHLNIADNTGLIIDDSLHIIRGDLSVNDKSTLFKISTRGSEIIFDIDSLRLDHILYYFLKKEDFQAALNINYQSVIQR